MQEAQRNESNRELRGRFSKQITYKQKEKSQKTLMLKKEEGKTNKQGKDLKTYCCPREENNWPFNRNRSLKQSIGKRGCKTDRYILLYPQLPSGNQYVSTEMTPVEFLDQRFQMVVISWLSIADG